MADGQVFRIEIPVEVTSKADTGSLKQIETTIQRTEAALQRISSTGDTAFSKIASGASSAASNMTQVQNAAQQTSNALDQAGEAAQDAGQEGVQAAEQAADAFDDMGESAEDIVDSVDDAADSFDDMADSAGDAGNKAKSSFDGAEQGVDRFTKRMEKSQRTLRQMFAEKAKMVLEAVDKISPVVTKVTQSVKSLAAKAWKVTVKLADLVTAPFRALKNMIMSPITMTLSIAGIGLGASSFYQTFTDFTTGMSNVKALSGATEEEFVQLTETAQELGATTKFTAAQASEGMQYLAMAGWETSEIIEAMPGLLQLAAAGATDLGTASDIVSDVMTAMGMSASEATRAADVFARTATSTNTTIANMGETLKYAAPIAHSFGLSLEEVSTITGMMANAGIKGSQAGTAIRSSLLAMASPSTEAAKAMAKLGLTFADSQGKMKDMKTIVRDLQTAFSGLSEQEKLAYADDIFGKYASSGWLGVINQGADAYDDLYDSILNSKGAAQEMADIQLDNLQGDVTLLQSAVDGMKITLMDKLDPFLRQGVQWVTSKIPEVTQMLSDLMDKGIAKATELKDFIAGVFDSPEMQNADSLADKLFIAWDKIIAQPFNDWWAGSGRDFVLNVVNKIGGTFGEVLHGVIAGVFAAIKGEEIDFDGLNLTGIAKAGAEAAKEYVSSFMGAFDLSGLVAEMPGMLKAGLLGFGAIKVGSGALGVAKTIGQLKLAFGGVTAAAGSAATATATVGQTAAAAGAGAAKSAALFGGLKTALSAIPVWGWVAAAALTAVTIGVVAYNNEQKKHEQDLLNTGKAAAQMAQDYADSVQTISDATATVQTIKGIQLKIEEDKGGNQEVIDNFNSDLDGLLDRTVYLTAALADDSLDAETIAAYQEELDALHGNIVELVANLNDEGYDAAQVAIIQEQVGAIEEGEKTVTLIIADKTELTPDQISEYVSRLSELMAQKTTYELWIEGHGLTVEEIGAFKTQLEDIQSRLSEVTVKINKGQGTMSDDEWNSLLSEAASLQAQAADIQILLQGSEMNDQEIKAVKDKLGEVRGEAAGIELNISYSDNSEITQEDLDNITGMMTNIGEIRAELNIGLAEGSMGVQELEDLNQQLNEAYGNLVEMSGGYFTQEDVEMGRITPERYDAWLERKTMEAEADRLNFKAQVEADTKNVPELMQKREDAQAEAQRYAGIANGTTSDYDFLNNLDAQRQLLLGRYRAGEISEDDLFTGGQSILQQARDHQWTEMAPANFMAIQPDMLFGDYTGPFWNRRWQANPDVNPFGDAINELGSQTERQGANYRAATTKADEANAALNQQYQNEVKVVEQDAFAGFGVADQRSTATIQELAASYDTLDAAGQQMFADAIAGLQQLNSTTGYISEAEKVNTGELVQQATESVTTAANVEVLGDVQSKLTELSTTYSTLNDETAQADFNAANIEAVNAALDALGVDKISSLSELQSKLQEISAIDPSGLSFDAAAASLTALGGNASDAKAKLDQALASLRALDGQTAHTTVMNDVINNTYNNTYNNTRNSATTTTGNANGGIYDGGAFLSWVAEDGPEAIIPLGAKRRDRGIDLWLEAGKMLGVSEFAEGGIAAPYQAVISTLPEDSWSDDGNGSGDPKPVLTGTSGGGTGGGNVIQITVEVNPEYEISGTSSPEEVMQVIRDRQGEVAEIVGDEIAEQLEDIFSNM